MKFCAENASLGDGDASSPEGVPIGAKLPDAAGPAGAGGSAGAGATGLNPPVDDGALPCIILEAMSVNCDHGKKSPPSAESS